MAGNLRILSKNHEKRRNYQMITGKTRILSINCEKKQSSSISKNSWISYKYHQKTHILSKDLSKNAN